MGGVLGIVAEYNPFHNGHRYHLLESKRLKDIDYVICVMSGSFTQRGNTSIIDKWSKAEMALLNGADLVIELPTLYSISSAENFALGAIKILNSLNIVNYLSFGSELGDIKLLNEFADVLYHEPKEYVTMLNHELSKGISYPKARENAMLMYLKDIRKYANIMSSPNNILSIEYLKALKKLKSKIYPYTIKREAVGYNERNIVSNFASATGIRNAIRSGNISALRNVMPANSYNILLSQIKKGNIVSDLSNFEKAIIYNLRKMSVEEIANLPDVSEGLENSIKRAADSCNSLTELKNIVKSKRYTETRIQRILLYSLLGITKREMNMCKNVTPYIRILGTNDNGKELLSRIYSSNPKLSVVTSVNKFMESNANKNLKLMLQKDIFATNVYTLGYEYDSWSNLDYTKKLIVL